MNYLIHYNNLIKKSQNRILDESYYEKHHYIPVSIFQNPFSHKILTLYVSSNVNDKSNLVYLLPEEHFVAHLLLVKIFKGKNKDCYQKMLYAASFLKSRTKNNKKYKWLRESFSKMMSKLLTGKPSRAKGKKWSEERKKLGQYHLKGKTYEEILGEENSKKLKRKRSSRMKKTWKENRVAMSKKLSERKITWGDKISKARCGVPMSDIGKEKIRKFMSNDRLNPNVEQTLYKFQNINTGEIIEARKIDMKNKFGCNSIHKVIRGERHHCMGWKLSI